LTPASVPDVVTVPVSARAVRLTSAPAVVTVPASALPACFSSAPADVSVPASTLPVCFTSAPLVVNVPAIVDGYVVPPAAGLDGSSHRRGRRRNSRGEDRNDAIHYPPELTVQV
jgi:hypothetical protein